ncbi:YqzE family protein [Salinibacillus xinjiangensis]|uniref:YqzE family protein n=2 Tax=Salinibacillus xinjiangensis TaxID=1229268 RepID=A0A6G1X6K8_9BACI|nr:YqzE family protein [Salinibacillus xinjiangensis]
MTQEFMKYIHLSKDEKEHRKKIRKQEKVNKSHRYFGMLPSALKMFWNNRKKGS